MDDVLNELTNIDQTHLSNDYIPSTFAKITFINKTNVNKLFNVLLDSGGTSTWITASCIPEGCIPYSLINPLQSSTIAGEVYTNQWVTMFDIVLPELNNTTKINKQGAYVFQGPCKYDIIFGRDFLQQTGIKLNFKNNTIEWEAFALPMKTIDIGFEPQQEFMINHNTQQPDINSNHLSHLSVEQQQQLKSLLNQYPRLFSNTIGKYKNAQVHISIDENITPIHARPYSIPQKQIHKFKEELTHLVNQKILRKCGATDWCSPTFLIPKKMVEFVGFLI